MKAFLLLILSLSLCVAQYMPMADPVFLDAAKYEAPPVAGFNPMSIPGYPCAAYYSVGSGGYTTNSSPQYPILTDLVGDRDLTNRAAASAWPTGNGSTITFDGSDDYLRTAVSFSPELGNTWEIVALYRAKSFAGGSQYVWYAYNSEAVSAILQPTFIQFSSGAAFTSSSALAQDSWTVFNYACGATGSFLTNTVACSPQEGEDNRRNWPTDTGISLGSYWLGAPGGYSNIELVELGVYATNLTATIRGQVYGYLKAKYSTFGLP